MIIDFEEAAKKRKAEATSEEVASITVEGETILKPYRFQKEK
jgi:hypothetical protein